jgi:mannose-6-phosphate isomerase-like protein (cupin superfamily)
MKKGYKGSLEALALKNSNFRKVLYTGAHCQLVLMSLLPGEDIGHEVHGDGDQFFRFEAGEGKVLINGKSRMAFAGDAVIVPAGAEHNIINTSKKKPLKFYTVYAPPHHEDGIVRKTKKAAEVSSPAFDGKVTEMS